MAHWHGLAKLRLHSDFTLRIMDDVTSAVGRQFRAFKATVCLAYDTSEIPLSYLRRQRLALNAKTDKQRMQSARQWATSNQGLLSKMSGTKKNSIFRLTNSMPWEIMYQLSSGMVHVILTARNRFVHCHF